MGSSRAMRELLDLTRMRVRLAQERSSIINRIEKILEDPNLKLGVVASDVVGVAGRAMPEAIIRGGTDPEVDGTAKGKMRRKIPQLRLALEGNVTPHHRFLLRQCCTCRISWTRKSCCWRSRSPSTAALFEPVVSLWTGKSPDCAAHLASWAAVCPGNHEGAGKRSSGRTRAGSPWLRRTLCEAAWAASRTKQSYFRALFHRLARTRGKTRPYGRSPTAYWSLCIPAPAAASLIAT